MTTKQCAKYLDMSYDNITTLCRKGRIPAVKVGLVWRINKTKLDRMLDGMFRCKRK